MTHIEEAIPFRPLFTQRLILNEIVDRDINAIWHLRTDPLINQFIKRNLNSTLEDARLHMEKCESERQQGLSITWAIRLRNASEMIGTICIWNIDMNRKYGEVGYSLQTRYHRLGLMNEAIQSVIPYGFDELKLETIEAFTDYRNKASIQLLLKNRFTLQECQVDEENENNRIYRLNSNLYYSD